MLGANFFKEVSKMRENRERKKQNLVFWALGFFLILNAGGLLQAKESESEKQKDPQAEFEAMKAEWEKVRDQQIEMIREKEAELDEMKETIFRQLRAQKGGVLAGADPATPEEPLLLDEAAQNSQVAILGKRIAELKEANRRLTNEISTLRIKNKMLEEKLQAPGQEGSSVLRKEKAELEAQKVAFTRERQKFFDEIARQKAKLQQEAALR